MTEEENLTSVSGNVEDGTNNDVNYITAIKELKTKNSLLESKLKKSESDNKQMLESFLTGEEMEKEVLKPKKSISELREDLIKSSVNNARNIELVKKSLALRDALIEEGKPDPYLPFGQEFKNPSLQDQKDVQDYVDYCNHCLEVSNGDPDVFDNEFMRGINQGARPRKF